MRSNPTKRNGKRRLRRIALVTFLAACCAVGWMGRRIATGLSPLPTRIHRVSVPPGARSLIVLGAHAQEGDTYDAAYRTIPYPNGDVAAGRGACTDVVIRALRHAGFDLQQLVHEDVIAAPRAYRIAKPDSNIDHRRVLTLMVFFERHGRVLPRDYSAATRGTWQPGDVVCWRINPRETHTGIVSDGVSSDGRPLVIHNAYRTTEADVLTDWTIIGHYRYPPG